MIKTVGVIGSGPLGRAVAARAVAGGQRVVLANSRGPESLRDVVAELAAAGEAASVPVRAGTVAEAAGADLVALAVPFTKVAEVGALIGDWTGRVVADATNQFTSDGGRADLGDETGSEFVRRHLPGATVVKAFNAMFAGYLAPDPRHAEGRQVVFHAGDDDSANDAFADLVRGWGFAPVYVGSLREGGRLMQLGGHLSAVHVLRQD
jgi:hypothetical protein